MKPEAAAEMGDSQSHDVINKTHSSPKKYSAVGKSLCRNLSPRKARPLSLGMGSDDDDAAQCNEPKRVFRFFDEDGDGKISTAEPQSCVRTVGGGDLSPEEAEMAVWSADSDGDGMLGFDDFVKLMEGSGEQDGKDELREAFGMYEMEGTGCITPKSLKSLSRLGESTTIENCKAMIRMFDLNGDCVLNFAEFRIMTR